jgi:hypothetical protein
MINERKKTETILQIHQRVITNILTSSQCMIALLSSIVGRSTLWIQFFGAPALSPASQHRRTASAVHLDALGWGKNTPAFLVFAIIRHFAIAIRGRI